MNIGYQPKNFYNYFKECYKQDYKEFVVDNILSRKYPFKWYVSGDEELFTDSLPYIPYDNRKVVELEKELELYKLEKKLFYGCFFVLGKNNNHFSKDKRFCAPLILFPARVVTVEDQKFLEIDIDAAEVNRSVLSVLESKNDQLSKDLFLVELSAKIKNANRNLLGLKKLIDKYFSNINTEEILLHPRVWPVTKIRKYFSSNAIEEDTYQIVPAAGTILVNKSESSLKVINDLNAIAEKDSFNPAMQELLSDEHSVLQISESIYKSRLNDDQYQALKNAYRFNNSIIIGPPGTGKTYTITSIISDIILNNQSVLVVSKTKQAVEVLRTMLQNDFKLKDYLIHTTGNKHKLSLKAKIRKYLSGIYSNKGKFFNESEINSLYQKLEEHESEFEELIEKELEISDLEFSSELSLLEKWRKFYLKLSSIKGDKLLVVFEEINKLIKQLDFEIQTYSKRKIESNIHKNSRKFRKDISLFYDAIDSASFTEFKSVLQDVDQQNILKVFPIWLANLSDLNSILPLRQNMFDVVIIDEATQCDIATALPALFRAKRAVIAGDPNQLRHYSFISRAQQSELQDQFELPRNKIFDYRERSILDLFLTNVNSQDQVSFLKEHFRSTPSLIEFSNQKFYEGQLKILKSTPKYTLENQIEVHHINGTRDNKGINHDEAEAVLNKLDEIFSAYKLSKTRPSIGIVSPFSSQVTYINKLLRDRYELDFLKRYQLLCGTPYNFQGSEREIIIISFGVCDHTHPSAFIHLNKPEVFNVAITRAKSFQYLFTSASVSNLKEGSIFQEYLHFIENFSHSNDNENIEDDFQKEVVNALKEKNYDDIFCGYPVAGSLLDILIINDNKSFFIDLIGYPGMYKEAFTLERYKTLARTGIKSIPLHYTYWRHNKVQALKKLTEHLK